MLAVPSKGRLQEAAHAFFARAGLELVQGRGARDYRGAIAGLPGVEVAYVSSAKIVGELAAGAAHFGVAGEELLREKVPDVEARLELLSPLGFGHANVVVAAPKTWIDVRTMADLDDVASAYRAKRGERMRVATNMSISPAASSPSMKSPTTALSRAWAQPRAPPLRARRSSSSTLRRLARRSKPTRSRSSTTERCYARRRR